MNVMARERRWKMCSTDAINTTKEKKKETSKWLNNHLKSSFLSLTHSLIRPATVSFPSYIFKSHFYFYCIFLSFVFLVMIARVARMSSANAVKVHWMEKINVYLCTLLVVAYGVRGKIRQTTHDWRQRHHFLFCALASPQVFRFANPNHFYFTPLTATELYLPFLFLSPPPPFSVSHFPTLLRVLTKSFLFCAPFLAWWW